MNNSMIRNTDLEERMRVEGYLTLHEAAARLGKSYDTIKGHAKRGRIKSVRVTGRVFVCRQSLIEYAGEGAAMLLGPAAPQTKQVPAQETAPEPEPKGGGGEE